MGIFMVTSLFSLCGCSLGIRNNASVDPLTLTPDDYEPGYYLSEEELPEDAYYIVRDYKNLDTYDAKGNPVINEDGSMFKHDETRFYPLYQAETNFMEQRTEAKGFESDRIFWVNYNLDEGLIPTMYQGDRLIYKSSTYIPTKYALEKFFDDGYTVGVCGLYQDLSGNYRYVSKENDGKGYTMSTSNAIGFDGLTADSIYFVAIGEERVSPLNISLSGTITGLDLMESYDCDIRTGTEKVSANLLCNVHYFSSAETYLFGSFSFVTDIIAKLNVPSYVTTGYYSLGSGGVFRYVADPLVSDFHTLTTKDYNDTIYTYNEDGYINGTTIGLKFDENYFLVADNDIKEDENIIRKTYTETITKEESVDEVIPQSSGGTKQIPTKSGNYFGTYVYDLVSEPATTGSGYLYTIVATCVDEDMDETLSLQFEQTATKEAPVEGKTYKLVFKDYNDTYKIVKATLASEDEEDTDVIEEEKSEETSE